MDIYERGRALSRVIAYNNDKGGVGKTSIVANTAGLLANEGYRVGIVDLNRQANIADDLGYRDVEGIDDQGQGLYEAITRGTPLQPIEGVRPNLSVVPGGTALNGLTAYITGQFMQQGRKAFASLGDSLAPIAEEYDFWLLDSPPENPVLADLALGAARWLVMPTKSDPGGVKGMKLVAERFTLIKEVNPTLGLLGVMLFASGSGSTAIHRTVRDEVAEAFGGNSPMFTTIIRSAEQVAQRCRTAGQLAHELAPDHAAKLQMAALKRQQEDGTGEVRLDSMTSVAGDYARATAELLTIISKAEAAPAGAAT